MCVRLLRPFVFLLLRSCQISAQRVRRSGKHFTFEPTRIYQAYFMHASLDASARVLEEDFRHPTKPRALSAAHFFSKIVMQS